MLYVLTKNNILFRIITMKKNVFKTIKIIIVNFFTLFRLFGAFALPFVYTDYGSGVCSICTICLFLTDAIDGFLARTLKVSTFFGSSMDALSDKILNTIAFILLGITYSIMIPPIILELAILLTAYNTYREGGNVQSTTIGKIKTVILDVCIIGSFILLSLPTLGINTNAINYIINNTPYYITLFGCICTIAGIIALLDYRKKNYETRKDPHTIRVRELNKTKKTFKEVIHDAFDTNYYLKHKDEPIMKQFYKVNA